MKKVGIWTIGAALLLSSCGTYTGEGAYAGGTLGAILGSAIGGISGGWRGSNIGTVVGMAGGAAVGAAIGAQADQRRQEQIEGYHRRMEERQRQYDYQQDSYQHHTDNSGFDATNSGDDRIDIGIGGPNGEKPSASNTQTHTDGKGSVSLSQLERMDAAKHEVVLIRNARFIDADQDGILKAGEECKITFEIMNYTRHTIYDVQPTVYEVEGNKNLYISPNLHVESIAPNSGVRYTATILADKKLKDGTARIRVGAMVNNLEVEPNNHELLIVTRRK